MSGGLFSDAGDLFDACNSEDPRKRDEGYAELSRILYRYSHNLTRKQSTPPPNAAALAEESVQETLRIVCEKIETVRVRETFISWSRRILCHEYLRLLEPERQYVHPRPIDEDDADPLERLFAQHAEGGGISHDAILLNGDLDCMLEAIARLPLTQRMAIVLQVFARMEDAEIAQALGMTRNTLQVSRSHGRTLLKRDRALARCLAGWEEA